MAKQLIFYLDTNRGIFFGDDLPDAKEVAFPEEIIKELELVNNEKLDAYLQAILQTYQLVPEQLTILLSNSITFDKDVTEVLLEKRDEVIKRYLDLVPFQDIQSRTYNIDKKVHVVAANNNLLDRLVLSFQKQLFTVTAVVPYSILQEIYPQLQENVDLNLIISKIDSFKQYSLILQNEKSHYQSAISIEKAPKNNIRLLLLVMVFGLLIVVLIIVFYLSVRPLNQHIKSQVVRPFHIAILKNTTSVTRAVAGISTHRILMPKFYYIHIGK